MIRTAIRVVVTMMALGAWAACRGNACEELAQKACSKAPNSKACRSASRLTSQAVCEGYLKDVDKYVKLMNQKVTSPPLKPPASQKPGPGPTARTAGEGEHVQQATVSGATRPDDKEAKPQEKGVPGPAKGGKDKKQTPHEPKATGPTETK